MNFINENDGVASGEEALFTLGFLYNIPNLLDSTTDSTKREKSTLALLGNDVSQGSLSGARRPPEDERRGNSLFYLHA